MADDVQPTDDGGQGADNANNGLYDLESVDPEIRDALQPHLKAIEANATKKFQEAAEYRKGWAPYEEMGIRDMEPEAVAQLLQFAQIASDPEQFDQWLKAAATERGIVGSDEDDDLDLDELDLSPEKVQELVDAKLAEKLSPIESTLTEQQNAALVEGANSEISSAFEQIKGDNPELFQGEEQEGVQEAIVRLAYSYADDESLKAGDIIHKGYEDYVKLIGKGEKSLFAEKAKQPSTPEGPGAPNTSPEKITSFGDSRLEAAALAKLRNS